MANARGLNKLSRSQVPAGANLCEHCTAKCCHYFALPIETPDDVRGLSSTSAGTCCTTGPRVHGGRRLVPAGAHGVRAPAGRQPLRHLRNPAADLPRLHDRELRIRGRVDLRPLPRNARAGVRSTPRPCCGKRTRTIRSPQARPAGGAELRQRSGFTTEAQRTRRGIGGRTRICANSR